MPSPSSPLAYGQRLYDILDRAAASSSGLEIGLKPGQSPVKFRQRLYAARSAMRSYQVSAGLNPATPWDDLSISITGPLAVCIRKTDLDYSDLTINEIGAKASEP